MVHDVGVLVELVYVDVLDAEASLASLFGVES